MSLVKSQFQILKKVRKLLVLTPQTIRLHLRQLDHDDAGVFRK